MNTSRLSRPACHTKSAFERNLNAKAISTRPSTTFTEFNQPPDLGKVLSHDGKMANSMNGNDSANEKPNSTSAGPPYPPFAAVANAVPTSAPVQLNDTIARVAAIKKMATKPVRLLAAMSILLPQLAGSWISNAPKKLKPKSTSSANRNRLKYGSVEITLSASAPKMAVIARPRPV